MKKMNNVMRNLKNVVFDLFVIVGGLAIIVMICKAVFNNADNKITTAKVKAAEVTYDDEAKYSDLLTVLVNEMDEELNNELYSEGKESNKNKISYKRDVNYLGVGMYKIVYTFTIYGNDELQYVAYADVQEEDGVGTFVLNGVRIDECVLDDIYPDIFD